jgi:putative transposase
LAGAPPFGDARIACRQLMSQRQRDYMVLLARIREQHRLSLESYGRLRMTEELQELNLNVRHRRVDC